MTTEENKALVLRAYDTLFNRRDYLAAEQFWPPDFIQHSSFFAPGRDGLFDAIRSFPETFRYEYDIVIAEGDLVIVYGRFSGNGPVALVAADVLRVVDGRFIEHWDVLQPEATRADSKSGLPMFRNTFPA